MKDPEDVEDMLESLPDPPIPSQTSGQCVIDSVTAALFYSDGLRQALWAWFFKQFPRGSIDVSDEELNPEFLRTDARYLTWMFLATIGTRVLRILDTEEPKISIVRVRSFSPAEDTHGTTPSEVCSNLGISLMRVLDHARIHSGRAGRPPAIIGPSSRTTQFDYSPFNEKPHQDALFEWILSEFLPGKVDQSRFGTFSTGKLASVMGAGPSRETPIAMSVFVKQIISAENPTVSPVGASHVFSVVRLNTKWYVADNEVGKLLVLKNNNDVADISDIIARLEDEEDLYFECQYTLRHAQYFIQNRRGDIFASTVKQPRVLRLGADVFEGVEIYREAKGIRFPPGAPESYLSRTILYWNPPASAGPAPDARYRAAGAAGGKRKTRKRKSKRRKTSRTSRGGRVRPSLPK